VFGDNKRNEVSLGGFMKIDVIEAAWQQARRCESCGIRELVLFADLTKADFDLIHHPIMELEFKPNEYLFKAGDPADYVYTLRSGLIKLVRFTGDGRQRIVRLLSQGDLAGIEALDGQPYAHHAEVLDTVSVCRIPVAEIENINQRSPRLYRQLMARWSKVAMDADFWIDKLSTGPAQARVVHLLLYLASLSEKDEFYLPSREDMGAMLAITTETASRIIARLRSQGILRVMGANQALVDEGSLRSLIQ
jgi:CRP-like cAMP-binding protein